MTIEDILRYNEDANNPDYICRSSRTQPKAQAWFVTDSGPQENENGIYVHYRLDKSPEFARGFSISSDEAENLIIDLIKSFSRLASTNASRR